MNQVYKVEVVGTEMVYSCKETESLLSGMERAGIYLFPVGCKGGGCGVCKVQVVEGEVELEVMSRAHISKEDEMQRIVLACRVKPKGNVKLRLI